MGGIAAVECGQMSVDEVVGILRAAGVACDKTIEPDQGETVIVCCRNAATLHILFSAADNKAPACAWFRSATGGSQADRKALFWTVYRALGGEE